VEWLLDHPFLLLPRERSRLTLSYHHDHPLLPAWAAPEQPGRRGAEDDDADRNADLGEAGFGEGEEEDGDGTPFSPSPSPYRNSGAEDTGGGGHRDKRARTARGNGSGSAETGMWEGAGGGRDGARTDGLWQVCTGAKGKLGSGRVHVGRGGDRSSENAGKWQR